MKALFGVLCCALLGGCVGNGKPLTPEEREDRQERMREFLDESSPRNMNQQPKVVPEINKTYNLKRHAEEPSEE